MDTPTHSWKLACENVEGHRAITLPQGAPMVAFSPLALSEAARSYVQQLDISELKLDAIRTRGGRGSYLNITGFYADPTRSGDAKLQLANGLELILPDGTGKPALIEHMTDVYARLASAWNRERLTLETRGQHNKKDNAHTDYGAEFVSIANLTNVSTLFAPPESYHGQRPHIFTPEGMEDNIRCEYPMTRTMQAALEGLPFESLASWRGSIIPAVHLVPEFEGTRTIMLANTLPHSKPALV